MIKFYKVAKNQFIKDYIDCLDNSEYRRNEKELEEVFTNINLPRRATKGSAGYDFFAPVDIDLMPGETIKFPSGIKAEMDEGVVLYLYPRSSLGFKYRFQLDNTTGVIDQDFYNNPNNEGDIHFKFTNCGNREIHIKQGEAIAQGVFMNFLKTVDDNTSQDRTGGIGSTNKK